MSTAPKNDALRLTASSKIINTTPHEIVICDCKGTPLHRYPSDPDHQLRVSSHVERNVLGTATYADGPAVLLSAAPVYTVINGPMQELLQSTLLVSMPVGEFIAKHPTEFEEVVALGPDTGPDGVVRDASGRIVGTTALLVYKH